MKYAILIILYLVATVIFACFMGWHMSKPETQKAFKELNGAVDEVKSCLYEHFEKMLSKIYRGGIK